MGAPLLLLLALLAVPASAGEAVSARAAAPPRVIADLSSQYFPECRDQADTGTCHAFASVSLLEAAIKRSGATPVRLSEADLFVRVTLAKGRFEIIKGAGGSLSLELTETGSPKEDIEFALSHGIAEASLASWDDFLKAYHAYRDEWRKSCSAAVAASGKPLKTCLKDDESALREFLDGLKGEAAQAAREKLLGSAPAALDASRKRVKTLLAGRTLVSRSRDEGHFDKASLQDVKDKDVCREKGRKQTDALTAQLDAGRPAVVCFNMEGLDGWDADAKKKTKARHCVGLSGYSVRGEGDAARKIFAVRNSWARYIITPASPLPLPANIPQPYQPPTVERAPVTHDITEDQACAINGAAWLTP